VVLEALEVVLEVLEVVLEVLKVLKVYIYIYIGRLAPTNRRPKI
jgi:hypothetical protein